MRSIDAIVAGTLNGAKLLGLDKTVESLYNGEFADVVAVQGDLLKDIRQMERPF
jgi:imidazolonepropionase-like amidohydrolase